MKAAAIVLGVCASLWSVIGSFFTYFYVASLLGIASEDAEKAASNMESAAIVTWILVLFFILVGIFSCLVYVLRIVSGVLLVLAALATIIMTTGNLFMFPAV